MTGVLIVQHVEPEGPGMIADALATIGLETQRVRVHEGNPVPTSIGECAALVVMGGPMSVLEVDAFRHLRDEMRLIEQALRADVPVLGVCLGSQLLAAVLGSSIRRSGPKEIGWHRVTLADDASADPLFEAVERSFQAFHWHGETFTQPAAACRLASSAQTACQAFRFGRAAYGLLFHLEVDAAQVDRMVEVFGQELADAGSIRTRLSRTRHTIFPPCSRSRGRSSAGGRPWYATRRGQRMKGDPRLQGLSSDHDDALTERLPKLALNALAIQGRHPREMLARRRDHTLHGGPNAQQLGELWPGDSRPPGALDSRAPCIGGDGEDLDGGSHEPR